MTTDTLPGMEPPEDPRTTGGSVYQGVNAQIRALFPNHTKDEEAGARYAAVAGIVASARSLAASIDRASGAGGARQASGHQLSLMHGQLLELLQALAPTTPAADPFMDLLAELGSHDRAPASHAP